MMSFIQAAFAAVVGGSSPAATPADPPFGVGESLIYNATYHFLLFSPGVSNAAVLSVLAIDTIEGTPFWKFSFTVDASIPLWHEHARLISWTGVRDFISRHFVHEVDETNYSLHDDIHIFPDSGFYRNVGDLVPRKTPAEPLDDVAFFYFIRLPSVPLELGKTYTYDRYFRGNRNPVTITVLRREPCSLPDKTRPDCLVINPVVEDPPHGMLRRSENARVWITDDARRIPVSIKTGSLALTLSKMVLAPGH